MSVSFRLRSRYEKIAAASNRLDSRTTFGGTQLLANVAYVDIDDPVERPELPAQHSIRKVLAREDLSSVAQKSLKQRKFYAGQIQRHVVQRHLPRSRIETEITDHERARCCRAWRSSAQDRAYSGDEFARVEWFWYVIIGSNFQAENPVDILTPRSEDQYRDGRFGTQSTQDIESSHAGQHQIEHN